MLENKYEHKHIYGWRTTLKSSLASRLLCRNNNIIVKDSHGECAGEFCSFLSKMDDGNVGAVR